MVRRPGHRSGLRHAHHIGINTSAVDQHQLAAEPAPDIGETDTHAVDFAHRGNDCSPGTYGAAPLDPFGARGELTHRPPGQWLFQRRAPKGPPFNLPTTPRR